jgi:hypothetical protein
MAPLAAVLVTAVPPAATVSAAAATARPWLSTASPAPAEKAPPASMTAVPPTTTAGASPSAASVAVTPATFDPATVACAPAKVTARCLVTAPDAVSVSVGMLCRAISLPPGPRDRPHGGRIVDIVLAAVGARALVQLDARRVGDEASRRDEIGRLRASIVPRQLAEVDDGRQRRQEAAQRGGGLSDTSLPATPSAKLISPASATPVSSAMTRSRSRGIKLPRPISSSASSAA